MDLLVVGVARRADGRSILGFAETSPGRYGFLRLVAPTPTGILYSHHYRIHDLLDPVPGDLLRVEAPWADRRPSQPENRVIDHSPWLLQERPAARPWIERLEAMPVYRNPLFGNPGRAVRASDTPVEASILYVEPEQPQAVCEWDGDRGDYRARLRFSVGPIRYDLPLVDARYNPLVRAAGEGVYPLERFGIRAPHGLRIVVTIGEPFHGWCYKLVACILPRRTATLWRDATPQRVFIPCRNPVDSPLEHARTFVAGA